MNISLRLANDSDLPLIMAWRSNPLVYAGFYQQQSPLVWDGHLKWWRSRNQDWRAFLVLGEQDYISRPIGLVSLGQLDHWSPEIGYMIGEITLWGQGIGTLAVTEGLCWLKEYAKEYRHITGVHTTIKDDNKASIKIVKKLGFKTGMPARKGEHYYYREL